ncbi:hypothetical protein [Pseudomonas sp. NPDC089758]
MANEGCVPVLVQLTDPSDPAASCKLQAARRSGSVMLIVLF